jgi:hypothetical protein
MLALLAYHGVMLLQLLRWSKADPDQEQPFIEVTISSKEDLAGLLAALAVLYHDEDLFRELSQQDLVAAVVYGDQLAIPRAVELGMQLLKEAASSPGGCTVECCRALAAVPIWPTCMLPLLPLMTAQYGPDSPSEQQQLHHGVLLSALGNLEAVWDDKQLQEMLLALPLPAAELLLSSNQLRVASEDTVLYTAVSMVLHNDSIQGRQAARKALAKCIRCANLSLYNHLAHATTGNSPLFSKEQQEQLLGMLSLRLVPTGRSLEDGYSDRRLTLMPKAWLLPPRAHLVPPSPVFLTWKVPVADIRQACRMAIVTGDIADLSCSGMSGVLSGTRFTLCMDMNARDDAGLTIGCYVGSEHTYQAFLSLNFRVAVAGLGIGGTMHVLRGGWSGWKDFFGVGPMGGDGWDEAAWAGRGLPAQGHIELQLTVEPL